MISIDLVAGLAGILTLWFCIPYLLKLWQIASLRRLCRNSRVIVLTYDDGPGKVLTPALLDVLANNNVHANFFMLGKKVETLHNQVFNVVAGGHVIGSHSFRHLHAWKNNPFKVISDIQAGFQIFKPIVPSNWFRPPYGKITLATLLLTWISRHKLAWWTIDSTDTWQIPLPIEKVVECVKNEGGGVVLMHDHDRKDSSMHEYVINLTLSLIHLARNEGYKIYTFEDLPAK
jgi:peptidoglycan-N-acetylglucosamine deacetylase